MKVLHVARRFTTTAWGGTETVVASLVREQLRQGDEALVLATAALDRPGCEELLGVTVERHPYTYARTPLAAAARAALDRKGGNPFSWGVLRRLLSEPGVDVFHCHTMERLAGLVRWAALRRRLPYVVQLHGGGFDVPAAEVEEMLSPARGSLDWGRLPSALLRCRRFLADADLVLALSAEEVRRVRARLPGVRVELLPNGVDPRWLAAGDRARGRDTLKVPGQAVVALTVARVDPQKGQEMLPEVLTAVPGLVAVVVGPVTVPGYDRRVLDLARAAGVADRLRLVGSLAPESAELADMYAAADLFVLPSRHEPFGIVALEAWSAALPVVASAVGGLLDLVRPGIDGVLVPPADAAALAAEVGRLAADREMAARLGEAGRERVVRELAWPAVAERLREMYRSVVEARR